MASCTVYTYIYIYIHKIIYISTLFYCSFLSISLLQIQIHFSVCLSKVDLLPWFGDHASACATIPRIRRITWTFETMQTVTASVFGWWRVGSRRALVGEPVPWQRFCCLPLGSVWLFSRENTIHEVTSWILVLNLRGVARESCCTGFGLKASLPFCLPMIIGG